MYLIICVKVKQDVYSYKLLRNSNIQKPEERKSNNLVVLFNFVMFTVFIFRTPKLINLKGWNLMASHLRILSRVK